MTRWAQWLVALLAAGTLVALVTAAAWLALSDDTDQGAVLPEPAGVVFGAVGAALFLVTAATFIGWTTLIYRALAISGAPRSDERYRWGWTLVIWFVPFANLIVPAQIIQDIWRAIDPESQRRRGADSDRSLLVGAWWLALVAGLVLTRVEPTAGGLQLHASVPHLVLALAGALAVAMVVDLTTRYEAYRHQVAEASARRARPLRSLASRRPPNRLSRGRQTGRS